MISPQPWFTHVSARNIIHVARSAASVILFFAQTVVNVRFSLTDDGYRCPWMHMESSPRTVLGSSNGRNRIQSALLTLSPKPTSLSPYSSFQRFVTFPLLRTNHYETSGSPTFGGQVIAN